MHRDTAILGGVHSSAERRARWGGEAISEGFVRFSVRCEYTEDLISDVAAALDASGTEAGRRRAHIVLSRG